MRRLTVTEAGRELYEACAAAVAAMLDVGERVTSHGPNPTGTLRITAGHSRRRVDGGVTADRLHPGGWRK